MAILTAETIALMFKNGTLDARATFIACPAPKVCARIVIRCRTWWQRSYGNTYGRARFSVYDANGDMIFEGDTSASTGGSQYAIQRVGEILDQREIVKIGRGAHGGLAKTLAMYCHDSGIQLDIDTNEVRRERDL